MQTEATRRAPRVCAPSHGTTIGSLAISCTPGPPAMISVSTGLAAGGRGAAPSASPADETGSDAGAITHGA